MKTKPKKILAWHWAKADLKTQHSNEPIAKGKTLKATGPLQLCENGMHASLNPMDALQYAPGPMLCRVELSGEIIQGEDKLCASSRKVLWIANADHMLQEFACLCAERALKAAKVDDPRSWRAIEVKRLWLAGKATDAELKFGSRNFVRQQVALDRGTPIFSIIHDRLENEWRGQVQDAVCEQIAEDRECAADDRADMRRDEMMLGGL